MISAGEGLARLRNGNGRFVAGHRDPSAFLDAERRTRLAAGQEPFAIVLGCSDSRVPVELVFDLGFGDLFVIRVAGNVAAPPEVGSVEYAAEHFGTPLVVVLGHSRCGAVQATIDHIRNPSPAAGGNLASIVDRIRPVVEPLLRQAGPGEDPAKLVGAAVRANIRAAAKGLRTGSEILGRLVLAGRLRVVGAEYSLESGIVDFFDGASD